MTQRDYSPFVQRTNVLRLIADHVPDELAALNVKIDDVIAELDGLRSYRETLELVAVTAGVDLTHKAP